MGKRGILILEGDSGSRPRICCYRLSRLLVVSVFGRGGSRTTIFMLRNAKGKRGKRLKIAEEECFGEAA